MIEVCISRDKLLPGAIDVRLAGPVEVGARVVFSGQARAEQGDVDALEVEHFPGMAEMAITAICERAVQRWPLHHIIVLHRVGMVPAGEDLVQVGVSAPHRREAFLACTYIMDFLKSEAPLWKKQHGRGESRWVEAKLSDAEAVADWSYGAPPEHER